MELLQPVTLVWPPVGHPKNIQTLVEDAWELVGAQQSCLPWSVRGKMLMSMWNGMSEGSRAQLLRMLGPQFAQVYKFDSQYGFPVGDTQCFLAVLYLMDIVNSFSAKSVVDNCGPPSDLYDLFPDDFLAETCIELLRLNGFNEELPGMRRAISSYKFQIVDFAWFRVPLEKRKAVRTPEAAFHEILEAGAPAAPVG